MEPHEFLYSVWVAQRPEKGGVSCWIFLSYKSRSDGSWVDVPRRWPMKKSEVANFLDEAQRKATDLYFCPNLFADKKRRLDCVLPSVWLYADLDPVDPNSLVLAPTSAWETSPNRFQCMWRVKTALNRKQHPALNQRLTYLTQADKGGWSMTKVLRVPGTKNFKRKSPTQGRLMWHDLQHYQIKTVVDAVRNVELSVASVGAKGLELPDVTADALFHKYKESIPKRARKLLQSSRSSVGERSDRLWELECLLLDAGIPPEEVLVMVRDTVWNKYAGQRRELPQLWSEILKAAKGAEKRKLGTGEMKLVTYSDFIRESTPTQLWTVEGIWSHDAHGLIAGEPKTFKSFIATDLAVSVASGTRFLGRFEVPQVGPVIVIQEENTVAMMKDRLEKIATSRNLAGGISANGKELEYTSPAQLPIYLMNNQRFNLTDPDHLRLLERWVKDLEPRLVVLDPIYLMMPGVDENSAVGLTPVLRDLLTIKQRYNVGMLIVHHYNKPREADERRPGNRISGSGVFYRWFESALYLEKGKTAGEVIMTPEHRGAAPSGAIHLEFDIGEMGETDYHVDVDIRKEVGAGALRRLIRDRVNDEPGITAQALADELKVSKERLLRIVQRMDNVKPYRAKPDGSPGRPPIVLHPYSG